MDVSKLGVAEGWFSLPMCGGEIGTFSPGKARWWKVSGRNGRTRMFLRRPARCPPPSAPPLAARRSPLACMAEGRETRPPVTPMGMKRIVICCDGTWNHADQENAGKPCPTNVIKIAYRLSKRAPDGTEQIIYYDQGVGTGDAEDKLLGGATGAGLEQNIHDSYIFLMANYE